MERRNFGIFTRIAGLSRAGGCCQCSGCSSCGYGSRCATPVGNGYAYEADHIAGRDDNSLGNLQILCPSCHRVKTDYSGGLARAIFGEQTAHGTAFANAMMRASQHQHKDAQARNFLSELLAPRPVSPYATALTNLIAPPPSSGPSTDGGLRHGLGPVPKNRY